MRRSLSLVLAGIGLSSASLAACSTPTQVTSSWRDPTYEAAPLRNWLVIGARVDATHRRMLEDRFAAELGAHGVRATPSYRVFATEALPEREEARAAVASAGYDGVLVSTKKGVRETFSVEPGDTFWGGFYGPAWVTSPPYIDTDEYVKFETTVWDPRGEGKLVWSTVTNTVNPTSEADFVSSLTRTIVPALTKAGFLPREGSDGVPRAWRAPGPVAQETWGRMR